MKKFCIVIAIICVITLTWCFVSAAEPQPASIFDTTIIEQTWCSGLDYGTVRMVGGWWHDEHMIEDEQGNVWVIEQDVEPNDFLLVWIVDNHTPKDYTDDAIVKVWREAY